MHSDAFNTRAQVNKHDHKLYEDAKRDLTQEIKKELAWEEEIIELTQWVKEARSVCPTYTVGMSQEDLAKEVRRGFFVKVLHPEAACCDSGSPLETRCHFLSA